MRYDEDERVATCQKEIQRLREVVRDFQDILNNLYIVIVDKSYVRDVEVFYPEPEDDINNRDFDVYSLDLDNRWSAVDKKGLYLGYYVWTESKESLLESIATKEGYDVATLTAIKVKTTE